MFCKSGTFCFAAYKMNPGKILYVIYQMMKNHTIPDIIHRMYMSGSRYKIILNIIYFLRNFHLVKMLALNMLVLIHPFKEAKLRQ